MRSVVFAFLVMLASCICCIASTRLPCLYPFKPTVAILASGHVFRTSERASTRSPERGARACLRPRQLAARTELSSQQGVPVILSPQNGSLLPTRTLRAPSEGLRSAQTRSRPADLEFTDSDLVSRSRSSPRCSASSRRRPSFETRRNRCVQEEAAAQEAR